MHHCTDCRVILLIELQFVASQDHLPPIRKKHCCSECVYLRSHEMINFVSWRWLPHYRHYNSIEVIEISVYQRFFTSSPNIPSKPASETSCMTCSKQDTLHLQCTGKSIESSPLHLLQHKIRSRFKKNDEGPPLTKQTSKSNSTRLNPSEKTLQTVKPKLFNTLLHPQLGIQLIFCPLRRKSRGLLIVEFIIRPNPAPLNSCHILCGIVQIVAKAFACGIICHVCRPGAHLMVAVSLCLLKRFSSGQIFGRWRRIVGTTYSGCLSLGWQLFNWDDGGVLGKSN